MQLLVTGGCGFIGSNFIHYMLETYPDTVIINLDKLTYAGNPLNLASVEQKWKDTRYFFVQGDIADVLLIPKLFTTYEIDSVVNFAAESHVDRSIHDPAPFVTTNVTGTQNLLEASRQYGLKRFVHISTDEVYGSLGREGQFKESTPLAPNSPYSASKAAADLLARAYYKTYNFPVIVTRCSNNYGPYQFPEKLVPLMYLKAKHGHPLPLYGDGTHVRDWIYVRDHCIGVDMALRKGKTGAIYNFGGNAEFQNIEVAKTILRIMGKKESLITFVKDRPGHDLRYAMDYSLAERELGWSPSVSFKEGLRLTIDWYENNPEWLTAVQSGAYREFMDSWYKERA